MTHTALNNFALNPLDSTTLQQRFLAQKSSYQQQPYTPLKQRLQYLTDLKKVLLKYQDDLAFAIQQDYGCRSIDETKIGEVLTCISQIDYHCQHLKNWLKPSKRHISLLHQPAKAWVEYQPLGVIGIIAPWNYPLLLSIGPLICALAAGNHAMLKISSASTHFAHLLQQILAEIFPEDLVTVVFGSHLSDLFSQLAFDKIIFTGSSQVGIHVMQAAAKNLTPVLLELGGKSPVIVHESMPLADVALRVAAGKLWNAGQTCVAPDYIFLPQGSTPAFIQYYQDIVQKFYPSLKDNPDYTAIINQKHYQRILDDLQQAQQHNVHIININPKQEDLTACRKIAPTLVIQPPAELNLMKNEIFAPILPILEYKNIDEAIQFINARPRPLALYYFDYHHQRADYVAKRTHSGHFGINQVITHVAQDDLPFGGVGASGMGKYHGFEGFVACSNTRSFMRNPAFYSMKYILPPFGKKRHQYLYKILLKK